MGHRPLNWTCKDIVGNIIVHICVIQLAQCWLIDIVSVFLSTIWICDIKTWKFILYLLPTNKYFYSYYRWWKEKEEEEEGRQVNFEYSTLPTTTIHHHQLLHDYTQLNIVYVFTILYKMFYATSKNIIVYLL